MTLEQRARQLAGGHQPRCHAQEECVCRLEGRIKEILAALRATREEAMERAAAIADEMKGAGTLQETWHGAAIAAAIRAEKGK